MECPYHHKRWRGHLQYLLNELRGKVLLNKHTRMFPKAVCVCNGHTVLIGHLEDIPELEKWIEIISTEKVLDQVRPILARFLNSASSDVHLTDETKEALITVVALIKAAFAGDFQALEPQLKDSAVIESPLFEEKLKLDLSSDCVGLFIGSGGQHLKSLCTKYSVQIQLGGDTTRSHSHRRHYITGSSVVVSLKHERNVDVETVKKELQKRADIVTQRRKKHTQNVQAYWERACVQRQARKNRGGTLNVSAGIYQNPKEAATGQFEKKQHYQKSRATKPSFSALLHGHCLLCMAPYKAEETQDGACTYHGGYLVAVKPGKHNGFYWSCCKKRTKTQNATHELHSSTGCSSGRHAWRPGKADKGKTSSSSATDKENEDFYVQ